MTRRYPPERKYPLGAAAQPGSHGSALVQIRVICMATVAAGRVTGQGRGAVPSFPARSLTSPSHPSARGIRA